MSFLISNTVNVIEYLFSFPKIFIMFIPVYFMAFPIISRFNVRPSKFQAFVELLYEALHDQFKILFKKEEDFKKWMPFFLALFFYILFHNLMGLIPRVKPITSDINVTASLAILIFLISLYVGISKHGILKFIAHLTPSGIPIVMRLAMFPIELVSAIAKPFSLAVRLFANMTAGHLIIYTLFMLGEIFGNIFVPFDIVIVTLVLLFECFVALIQAFIFAYLSAIYISDMIYMEH